MLLFTAPRDALLAPLQSVSGIVEKRHTLPILSNVLIEKKGDALTLLATDIEIQIRNRTTAAVGAEDVAITVGARKLQDILRALPDTADVSLTLDDKRITLKAGKSRFQLQTLPAADYPRLAPPEGEGLAFTTTQKAFMKQLALVQYAMAQQAKGSDRAEWAFMTAATLYLAQRSGHAGVVKDWFPRLDALVQGVAERRAKQLMLVVKAATELESKQAGSAINVLKTQLDGSELIQVHVVLRQAYLQQGDTQLAEAEQQWLARQRGLAYAENPGTYSLMARNVADVLSARQR